MKILKYIISGVFIIFIFTGCETKDKIDSTAEKVEQMERNQIAMQKEINYYKNKEKEATSYFEYVMYILFLIIVLVALKKIISNSAKLINRG